MNKKRKNRGGKANSSNQEYNLLEDIQIQEAEFDHILNTTKKSLDNFVYTLVSMKEQLKLPDSTVNLIARKFLSIFEKIIKDDPQEIFCAMKRYHISNHKQNN